MAHIAALGLDEFVDGLGASAHRSADGDGRENLETMEVRIEPMANGFVWSNCTESTKCETSIGGTMAGPKGDSPSMRQVFMRQPSYQGL